MRNASATWATVALALGGCYVQPVRDARIVDQPAVVTIVGWTGWLEGGGGSGFLVAPDRVVTCRHVVEGTSEVYVRLANGRQVPVRGVVADSAEHDLALLAIDPVDPTEGIRPLAPARVPLAPGASLVQVGSPDFRAQTSVATTVKRVESADRQFGPVIVLRGGGAPGASGAPLLDAEGRFAGVMVGGPPEGDLSYAVPSRFVAELHEGPLVAMADWAARTQGKVPLRAVRRVNEARQEFKKGDFDAALRLFRRASAELGADAEEVESVHAGICRCLSRLGRDAEIFEHLRRVSAEHPEWAWLPGLRGECLGRSGRYAESLEPLRLACAGDPRRAYWRGLLSSALLRLGRDAEAEAEIRTALRLDPEWAWAHDAAGILLVRQGRFREAIPELEEAVRLDPDREDFRAHLATARSGADPSPPPAGPAMD